MLTRPPSRADSRSSALGRLGRFQVRGPPSCCGGGWRRAPPPPISKSKKAKRRRASPSASSGDQEFAARRLGASTPTDQEHDRASLKCHGARTPQTPAASGFDRVVSIEPDASHGWRRGSTARPAPRRGTGVPDFPVASHLVISTRRNTASAGAITSGPMRRLRGRLYGSCRGSS